MSEDYKLWTVKWRRCFTTEETREVRETGSHRQPFCHYMGADEHRVRAEDPMKAGAIVTEYAKRLHASDNLGSRAVIISIERDGTPYLDETMTVEGINNPT